MLFFRLSVLCLTLTCIESIYYTRARVYRTVLYCTDHGISFYESFGDLALTTYLHVVGLRDLGPTMAPMNAYVLRIDPFQRSNQRSEWGDHHPV